MQTVDEALLDSWDRQAQIVQNLAKSITPEMYDFKSGKDEWCIGEHLCHIHGTRRFWMRAVDPNSLEGLVRLHTQISEEDWEPIRDLPQIVDGLRASADRVKETYQKQLQSPNPQSPYDHPVLFLQHMIWHEGWHVGAIMQALRANGQERPEEWEEPNIWGVWRTE
jgi:uncharacterized damage-inducible protein DinB